MKCIMIFQKIYHGPISKHVYHNRSSSITDSFFHNYLSYMIHEEKESLAFTFLKISIINHLAETKGLSKTKILI